MATIYYFNTFINGVVPGYSYLTSGDGYLHVRNVGPAPLLAAFTSASSPSAPLPNNAGIYIPPEEWTLVPADNSGSSQRIAFTPLFGADGIGIGSDSWDGMIVWVI